LIEHHALLRREAEMENDKWKMKVNGVPEKS